MAAAAGGVGEGNGRVDPAPAAIVRGSCCGRCFTVINENKCAFVYNIAFILGIILTGTLGSVDDTILVSAFGGGCLVCFNLAYCWARIGRSTPVEEDEPVVKTGLRSNACKGMLERFGLDLDDLPERIKIVEGHLEIETPEGVFEVHYRGQDKSGPALDYFPQTTRTGFTITLHMYVQNEHFKQLKEIIAAAKQPKS